MMASENSQAADQVAEMQVSGLVGSALGEAVSVPFELVENKSLE